MNSLAHSRSKTARYSRVSPTHVETTLITTLLLHHRGIAQKKSNQKCLISIALLREELRYYTSASKMRIDQALRSPLLYHHRHRECLRNSQTPAHHYPQQVRGSMLKTKTQAQGLCLINAVRSRSRVVLPMDLSSEFLVRTFSNSNTPTLTNRRRLARRMNCQALQYNRHSLVTTNPDDRWTMLGKCLTARDLHHSRE